jgi:hypothetical protein
MRRDSGFQSVKAFTGPADHRRQESQWQYPIATGSPVTSNCTAPQKQAPLWLAMSAPVMNCVRKQLARGG